MGDLVNLRQQRKRRSRDEKERRAAENRVLHGLSKAQKKREAWEARLDVARLDGHRREPRKDR